MDVAYKIDLINFIINYPETGYYVEKIGSINQKINKKSIVCDAIQINTYTENYGKQNIFIHSGINGLKIGEMVKKNDWINNWYIPMYGNEIIENWFV